MTYYIFLIFFNSQEIKDIFKKKPVDYLIVNYIQTFILVFHKLFHKLVEKINKGYFLFEKKNI